MTNSIEQKNRAQEWAELQAEYAKQQPSAEQRAEFAARLEELQAAAPIKAEKSAKPEQVKRLKWRWAAGVAAVLAVLIAAPNLSAPAAKALAELPLVGPVFQVITFRDYNYESERFSAQVQVPELINDAYPQAVKAINADIAAIADQLIAQFEDELSSGEGYQDLQIDSQVVCDSERWFSLKVMLYQGSGSGTQSFRCYNIDKQSGEWVQLGALFAEPQALDALTANIQNQMRQRMAADENLMYWLDDPEIGEENNFTALSPEQNFYFTPAGDLVIVFDEYQVAPGYMGSQEFTIPAAELPTT